MKENNNYLNCKILLEKLSNGEIFNKDVTISSRSEADLLMIDNLLTYLRGYLDYTSEFCTTLLPMLEIRILEKMTMFGVEGDGCTDVFWLQSGYGRYFINTTDEEGLPVEETIDFCKPGKILVISECLFNGEIRNFNLQLASGAVVIPLPKKCFESLKLNALEVEELANKIIALDKQDTFVEMKMRKMKPRERYQEFLRIFGVEIEQYFAVKHIASYLGMQPSYLSRLRGENFKKKSD
ncbi:MAG: hypothetical protein P0Y49_07460 [Candidatus Pedobacter colombiensis]|uniref:Crp/Fnr family transcriptional regulator n=1 Tax=Candidatus Pedobacter colombiensis TaxID=3121371 RepID=A0AAJ6B8K2_9SPHI|nr:hypothetical protein [Pedobacter sp.]WEK20974.1 MAG: hypothetical protein P0Y49_07460 [Pedobacter sp.]